MLHALLNYSSERVRDWIAFACVLVHSHNMHLYFAGPTNVRDAPPHAPGIGRCTRTPRFRTVHFTKSYHCLYAMCGRGKVTGRTRSSAALFNYVPPYCYYECTQARSLRPRTTHVLNLWICDLYTESIVAVFSLNCIVRGLHVVRTFVSVLYYRSCDRAVVNVAALDGIGIEKNHFSGFIFACHAGHVTIIEAS